MATKLRTQRLSSVEGNLNLSGFDASLDLAEFDKALDLEVNGIETENLLEEEITKTEEEKPEERKEKKQTKQTRAKKEYTIELTDVPGRVYTKRRSKEEIEEDKKNGVVHRSKKRQYTLMIWDSNVEGLEAIAKNTGYTQTDIINQILRNYLKQFE